MTRLEDRQTLIGDIAVARAGGARLAQACALAGIDPRTVQRWSSNQGVAHGDRRPDAIRPVPTHALTAEERARIVAVANQARFAETPPARIVPALADEGIYIASESSFHRVLRAHGQMHRRGRARSPRRSRPPSTHIATRPGEVWCWDVTFLPAQMQGRWFYLYLILDLYSRKIVGFEVHATDNADHAADPRITSGDKPGQADGAGRGGARDSHETGAARRHRRHAESHHRSCHAALAWH